jgi:hypothetical protein
LYNQTIAVFRGHSPIPEFPGDYNWGIGYVGSSSNPTPYYGKIYILVNEITMSQGEFTALLLSQCPNASSVKIIGSTTAGTDGDVAQFYLPGSMGFQITGEALYYADSTVCQRVGIVPDTVVIPTPAGLRHHVDELLMAAFDCLTGVNENSEDALKSTLFVYPNPTTGIFSLKIENAINEPLNIEITDITGRLVYARKYANTLHQYSETIDLRETTNGSYLLKATIGNHSMYEKIIVSHN